ncbi:hypothetical protein ACFS5J_08560 [Flavobacterium chuncheonense]|uniref:DUF3887 domain-containing protein n=1 Tax=Flavobacterium chuncheonense TaxID=2026653 RepID=A0ABW5YNP6_9FLAO
MKKVYLLFLIAVSCTQIVSKQNDGNDIKVANKYVNEFYNQIIENDSIALYNSLDKSISVDEFRDFLESKKDSFGNIVKVEILNTKTFRVTKNNETNLNFSVELEVMYEGVTCNELVVFTGENDESLFLDKYLVNEIK